MTLFSNILELALDVAPWLLAGLALAGILKAWIPEERLSRWLGGRGLRPIATGAVIGAPLPLCSCGSIPAGVALYRGGASRGATTSFMVGTPGIGVDSVVLTYALMGPFMAVVRTLSSVFGAIVTGLLVAATPDRREGGQSAFSPSCCDEGGCAPVSKSPHAGSSSVVSRTRGGLRYAFDDVLGDIGPWMVLGIVLAGALVTWIPPDTLFTYGSGPGAMAVMALIGIPLYLCAQAATPVAAAMILAGVSPGTALVFLLAAPMTSLATLGVLRREFGLFPVMAYLAGIFTSSIGAGLSLDFSLTLIALDIAARAGESGEMFPPWIASVALAVLILFTVRSVGRRFFRRGKGQT